MNVDFSAEELRSLYCFLSELRGEYERSIKKCGTQARRQQEEKLKVLELHMRRVALEEAIARLEEETRFQWKKDRV